MKTLNKEQFEDLQNWLKKFDLPNMNNKKINRDFSDCVLLAQILKQLYPRYVELHNYPSRSSIALKFDSWETLNRKVLKKLGLYQSNDFLHKLSRSDPGAAEYLLYQIMIQSNNDLQRSKINLDDDNYDSDDTDIMNVNVTKKIGDALVQVPQKMILYSLYEEAQDNIAKKNQTIAILTQKITHLENFLKLKVQRIDDLSGELARRSNQQLIESIVYSHKNSTPCLLNKECSF